MAVRTNSYGIRLIALLEGAKGAVVFLTGFGLLGFIHRDLHAAAVRLVELLHVNPARQSAALFIDAVSHVTNHQLQLFAVIALGYSLLRFAEAWGLWRRRWWAEWFGLVSGGAYLPLELLELYREVTWPRMTLFLVNLAVVAYLAFFVHQRRREH